MKKLTTLIAILLCTVTLIAQAPEKFTYQAVVRNASNSLVSNTQVGVRVSLLQGSATGNAVYVETQSTTTNTNGLLSMEIGGGTVQQGTFANIDWASGPFFLKTEIDPNGGTNYSITSTQQMLSVPYALYAKESGNGFSGDYNDLTNTPTIPTVPTNVSAFTNDAGYITMDSVPAIPTNVSAFSNDAGYITGYTETDPQFNAWDKDYNDLINTPTIPTVPTNVSAFTNDAGYITTDSVPAIPTNVSAFTNDAGYITMDSVPAIPTNVSAFTNDAGYLTDYSEQQILTISNDTIFLSGGSFVKLPAAAAGFSGDYNDLTNKPTIPTVPTNVSAFTNDAGYLTAANVQEAANIPTNVSAFANDAGYLTEYTETDPQFNAWDKDYNDLINTPTIPTVPTNVSAFTNDAGYITSYTETDPQFNAWDKDYNDLTNKPVLFDGDYNSLTNRPVIPTVPTNVSAFTNDAGYITGYTETDPQFNAWDKDYNDLINTPTIPTVPTNVSAFENDAQYITAESIPTNVSVFENDAHYITEGELQQTVNVINSTIESVDNAMSDVDNTIDSLRDRINELEGNNTPPTVMTTGVADVSYLSATVNGSVIYIGGAIVAAKGFCYDTVMHPTVENATVSCGSGSGEFSANLLNLKSSKTYYVRAYATNMWGTNYGEEKVFTTLTELAPSVEITTPSVIAHRSITCNGDVTDQGTYPVSARGFCYAATPDPVMTDSHVHAGNGTGPYTAVITGLEPESTYYVRAYAVNAYGVSYSSSLTLTTLTPTAPVVTTDSVSMYNECMATVVSDGGANVTQRGFCYDTLPNPTLENNVVYVDGGEGEFAATLSGLPIGKLYFVRAFATNAKGTTYGNQFDFYGGCDMKTLTDYDGNVYNTVLIGNQCWMKENLKTTHYSDGWPIEEGGAQPSSEIALYYYPDNSTSNKDFYGLLYNWKAVMREEEPSNTVPSGVQGICPEGWHMPSYEEWTVLKDFVGAQAEYRCEGSTQNVLSALADSVGWNSGTYCDCCPGNVENNNATGFSARPAGWWHQGKRDFMTNANFWTSSVINERYIDILMIISYTDISSTSTWSGASPEGGRSVRCLRNEDATTGNTPVEGQACPDAPTVSDYDNNVYNTVQIGEQCWMKENLRTTHYADGSEIVLGETGIGALSTSEAYYYTPSGSVAYGYLYNWKAVMHNSSGSSSNPSGVQGICPTGWHVPSHTEWTQLTNYLINISEYLCDSEDNTSYSKALAAKIGWNNSDETCTVGNILSDNNATGFSALPAGYYDSSEYYTGIMATFWTTTENGDFAGYRSLQYNINHFGSYSYGYKGNGCSVRCLKD